MPRRLSMKILLIAAVAAALVPASAGANGVPRGTETPTCSTGVAFAEPGRTNIQEGFTLGASLGAPQGEPKSTEGYGLLSAAGDLDADGRQEATEQLVLVSAERSSTRLSAVDGPNGATMWSREFREYVEVIPIGDLDGAPGDAPHLGVLLRDAPRGVRRHHDALGPQGHRRSPALDSPLPRLQHRCQRRSVRWVCRCRIHLPEGRRRRRRR